MYSWRDKKKGKEGYFWQLEDSKRLARKGSRGTRGVHVDKLKWCVSKRRRNRNSDKMIGIDLCIRPSLELFDLGT